MGLHSVQASRNPLQCTHISNLQTYSVYITLSCFPVCTGQICLGRKVHWKGEYKREIFSASMENRRDRRRANVCIGELLTPQRVLAVMVETLLEA